MNKFYSISEENKEPVDIYQLSNLGKKRVSAIIGKSSRAGWGERSYSSQTYYSSVTEEDYDYHFINKLIYFKPIYELSTVLEYHLNYYVSSGIGTKENFIKHIEYVIFPIIEKKRETDVHKRIITEWLSKMKNHPNKDSEINLKIGSINSPTQLQINTNNSSQNQKIEYSNQDMLDFLNLLRKDLNSVEGRLKDEIKGEVDSTEKRIKEGRDIKGKLLTIGNLIKEIGLGVFTSLISSPIYDLVKPLLGI